ncbi:aminobutyraldehyde dehydrogenase [uncultured Desulfosarcina sp.]|uniref:aminobutyraldehyde dehydrogenase n=1 Tax=uncultured Desulfosarcina sp. TaxID=218289 RepID=UPI0029C6FE86|nr:aminobutyraldehyde dehydrogenase [uncultured Desulfosarcina sp.]
MDYKLWIDGKWTAGKGSAVLDVEDPATGEKIDEVVNACEADVNDAVAAAQRAFYDGRWSGKTPSERSAVLNKMADLIEARSEEFARIESEDTGKPYEYLCKGIDIPFGIDNLRFFAAATRDTSGSHAGEYAPGFTSIYRREPCGVTAGIAPWNYPFLMAMWKIGAPLAAGCTSVIKPASLTPRTTLLLGEIAKEAGLPDGVLNVISGNVGHLLTAHPDVRMVSLTGATETGKNIMRTAADTIKRVHLELGGKAPALVFEDADAELVAQKVIIGGYINTGQDCTAATRIIVHKSRLAEMTDAIVAAAEKVKVGMPFDKGTEMGPLISANQRETVMGFVERAKQGGAKILTGGKIPAAFEKGYFYEPTVITNVGQDAECVQEEIFGPVLVIQSFDDEAEALAMGNDVVYGLAASIFTDDVSRAMRLSAKLEFGTVWINDHTPLSSETPHGGFKQSGFGKDLSAEAVGDYLVTKHVMIAL